MEKTLTETQMLKSVKEKSISKFTEDENAQVFEFMFGSEYMASDDKGSLREYE